jgi:hypothetical protein
MPRSDIITRFRALNTSLAAAEQRRFYPQITFEDPYVRFTEVNLVDLLYAKNDQRLERDMRTIFGSKADCHDLVYSLFIERTRHAKTTISMTAAADTWFFDAAVPIEREKGWDIKDASGMCRVLCLIHVTSCQ